MAEGYCTPDWIGYVAAHTLAVSWEQTSKLT